MTPATIRSLVGWTLLIAVLAVVVFFGYAFNGGSARTWRGVEAEEISADWVPIPHGARDITCYAKAGFASRYYFECSLDQDDLKRYAMMQEFDLKPLSEPVSMLTYTEHDEKLFSSGLHFDERHPNGGGISVVYQPEVQKLYVQYNHN